MKNIKNNKTLFSRLFLNKKKKRLLLNTKLLVLKFHHVFSLHDFFLTRYDTFLSLRVWKETIAQSYKFQREQKQTGQKIKRQKKAPKSKHKETGTRN